MWICHKVQCCEYSCWKTIDLGCARSFLELCYLFVWVYPGAMHNEQNYNNGIVITICECLVDWMQLAMEVNFTSTFILFSELILL